MNQIPLENLEILGISQINELCKERFENEYTITRVTFLNETIKYDEREGLVLSDYFELRKCPKCKKSQLIATKMTINMFQEYLRYEERVAYNAYSEYPSKTNTPTIVEAYCKDCHSAFEIRIKNKDLWIKQAKKLKSRDLIGNWEEYLREKY